MVLEDHIRKKRRLIPRLLAAMGDNYSPYSWANQLVPELFWLSLLIQELGPEIGIESARQLGEAASRASQSDPKPLFAPLSSFLKLSDQEKEIVKNTLSNETLGRLRHVLGPISEIWPDNSLSFLKLTVSGDVKDALCQLSPILESMYDRHGRSATLSVATAVYLGLKQNRIFISSEIYENRKTAFKDIERYPDTEESRSAGAFFRAMAPAFLSLGNSGQRDESNPWVERFWRSVSELGDCVGIFQEILDLPEETRGIDRFITAFSHFAQRDMRARQKAWPLDLNVAEGQGVVLALLARQTTLAIEIISSPGTWNPNVAPVLLRAMADVYITLAWILGDIRTRVPMYVSDGLGAIKLEIAHREAEASANPEVANKEHASYTEYLKKWLEFQRLEFLVEVNRGSWSGKSTRVMAEEAGCIDFYNFVFQPFSSAVHSYWSHVGRIDVEYCQNPAHNFHFLPVIRPFEPDPHWCHMAAKYLAKSLDIFDEFIGRSDLPTEAYAVVVDAFSQSDGKESDQKTQ